MQATQEKITSANHPRGWYPLAGWYLKNWREAKAQLAAGHMVRVAGKHEPMNREQFDAFMRAALDRRINAKGGTEGTGRKYTDPVAFASPSATRVLISRGQHGGSPQVQS